MLDVARNIDRANYIDLAHDVYYNLVKNEDLTKINTIKGYIFKCLVNHNKNNKTSARNRYKADLEGVDLAVNDYMDTDKLQRLSEFELDFIAVVIACDGNMLKVHELTKISRGSCDKYKMRIFAKLK